MSDLIFYTNPMSRGRIARWMLEEVGAPYETRVLSFGPEMKTPEYLAINPMGKVPAIVHHGHAVSECAAICAYLAESFPSGLAPTEEERADYYRWMFFAAGPVEASTANQALNVEVPPEKAGMVGYGSCEAVADVLEQLMKDRDYICGARFTAADVYVGSQIIWGLRFGTLPERPAFSAYKQRLIKRTAYIRATELDDALVAKATETTA